MFISDRVFYHIELIVAANVYLTQLHIFVINLNRQQIAIHPMDGNIFSKTAHCSI